MATKSNKNPAAVALGRLGGLKGGPALAAKMTPAQRKAAAKKAALARWSKCGKKPRFPSRLLESCGYNYLHGGRGRVPKFG
jgi:hypothetical protein